MGLGRKRTDQVLGTTVLGGGTGTHCLGSTRLTVTRAIKWNFIVAEIGDDEGILGNDFALAHELTVRPCKGAVYLPTLSRAKEEHMGQRLPCTVRVVTEVRAIREETLAVRAVGPATLAPHTVTQVQVAVPTPGSGGTVMIEAGPGPLGLCPVRGRVEVELQPIRIERNEVVAMAEYVTTGACPGDGQNDGDEVNGLVERSAPHLTNRECQQLRTAMAARRHLFATGKGDLGRTDIVQHQIHTGDQSAIKQLVRREEERQLVEDMLAIRIIQESNSARSSPTVLVKKKDGMTRFCIEYRRLNQVTNLMVGCYFSKWLECFPIQDQKATKVARKLVYEIVARYGAFRELHSDQGTKFG